MPQSQALPRPSRIILLGHPVSHSLSPVFQNAAIRAAGFDAVYSARDVLPEDLERLVPELRNSDVAGNVTIPHKQRMAELCDTISPIARRTNAVNTFRTTAGVLEGDNTDVAGFTRAVSALLGREPQRERVALLGAGGAAAAVLAAVEGWPDSKAAVMNRGEERLRELVKRFSEVATPARTIAELVADATIVVNATSIGLHNHDLPLRTDQLPQGACVLDLVYRPGETALVREARKRGMRAADGIEMLLEQGALAFMHWFDYAPDKMVMRNALGAAILEG